MLRFLGISLLLLSGARAAAADDGCPKCKALAALKLAQAQREREEAAAHVQVPPPAPRLSYAAARREAIRTGRPLVVGVGCPAPAGDWLAVEVEALPGFASPCVVVARPRAGELWQVRTLPDAADPAAVAGALAPPPVLPLLTTPAPAFGPTSFAAPSFAPSFGGGGACRT